jgi:hypothetical protein
MDKLEKILKSDNLKSYSDLNENNNIADYKDITWLSLNFDNEVGSLLDLSEFRQLSHLELNNMSEIEELILPDVITHLGISRLSNIKKLIIPKSCSVSIITNSYKLKEIDFSKTKDLYHVDLSYNIELKKIENLNMSSNRIDNHSNRLLNISNCKVTDIDTNNIDRLILGNNKQLKKLNISDSVRSIELTDSFVESLESINRSYNYITKNIEIVSNIYNIEDDKLKLDIAYLNYTKEVKKELLTVKDKVREYNLMVELKVANDYFKTIDISSLHPINL